MSELWEYVLRIPHSSFGPGIVRAHVRAVLSRYRADPTVLDNAQLVASELVTNSLAASPAGPVGVRLVQDEGRLWLGVRDGSPCPPLRGAAGPDSESGRGLWLLQACADGWGHHVAGEGKEVWVEWRSRTVR
ncbi:hypothetical protein GCM10010145_04930 [Streptomyces ruber]|uniref:Histidine kinase/HSP90-like ATPase domain-containing protein n=2 Tax=Streptomyces TaxID=1883 RepID=A0A918B6V0_9ACTN|nr:ATP-binding protein [Streptomyces ruber]GGQ40105.1 hypothetical protein GCM10010145_04930 [Streptomyces ruber]